MKAKPLTRESSKARTREESRQKSGTITANLIKKISRTIALAPTTKDVISTLTSQRGKAKVDPIKMPYSTATNSVMHSRKNSIGSARIISSGRNHHHPAHQDHQIKRNQEYHHRNGSTFTKKHSQELQNCFKIDISQILAKEEKKHAQEKILNQQESNLQEVSRLQFEYQYVIGKGGFGKVWSVVFKKNRKVYAMKEMMKAKIVAKKSIQSVLNERDLLANLKHPFIVNMNYAFQDREHLYLVMDLLVGGDLRYHMGCRRRFKESEAKFFIACILLGLEFLHVNNIIHRDIKPENLVFDEKGYLRVTDLGIARYVKPNNSADTSGTPGYMAPEVMCRQDHSFPVDFFAVGVIAYELMLGKRPYRGADRKEIRDDILSRQVQIRKEDAPLNWSQEAVSFVNSMIQRKPADRLGTAGMREIKDHQWFRNFPWSQVSNKTFTSPFIPANILNSSDYREQISETSENENDQENQLLLRKKSVEQLFEGYNYYSKEKAKESSARGAREKRVTSNAPTTAVTHNSCMSDKEPSRSKPFINNYFK